MKTKIKEEIKKKFLGIRGWKNWEEYDRVRKSLETDINARNELIDISIKQTIKEVLNEIDNLDILQLCTKLKDKKTGEIIKIPKEIQQILFQYGDYIKDYLKERLGK